MNVKKRISRLSPLILSVLFILLIHGFAYGQNVAINADGSLPNKNAILDIKSANKGLLIPRMSTEARLKIPNTQGLMVYDINTNSFWYNTGRSWQNMASAGEALSAAGAWLLTGNAGTVDNVNFLGTTDNVPLNIRVNNQRSGRIDPTLENTFWGYKSGFMNPTGKNNTGIGSNALFHTTTGYDNTAVGSLAMIYNTSGWSNSAFGRLALESNTTGSHNTAIGQAALEFNSTGHENVAVGAGAAISNGNSSYNTAIGVNTQFFHQGSENTSVGAYSLAFYDGGTGNTAVGFNAMRQVEFGSMYNTAIGHSSRIWVSGTSTNVAKFSTALGYNAEVRGSNSTALGHGAVAEISNKVRIGNAAVTVIEGQVPYTFPSDGRFKFGVQEDVKGLDFILQLRPVTYHFDTKRFDAEVGEANSASDEAYNEATGIRRSGFIAQEVEQAAIKAGYNFSGVLKPKTAKEHYSLSYDAFVMPLVKAVQEQQAGMDAQRKKIEQQEHIIEQQNKKIADLKREMDEIKKLLQRSNN